MLCNIIITHAACIKIDLPLSSKLQVSISLEIRFAVHRWGTQINSSAVYVPHLFYVLFVSKLNKETVAPNMQALPVFLSAQNRPKIEFSVPLATLQTDAEPQQHLPHRHRACTNGPPLGLAALPRRH